MKIPFEGYPGRGRQLLGKRTGASCRREYGLRLQRITGHTHCVYCDLDLTGTFEHWLMMSVDHAIPTDVGKALGVPGARIEDYSNLVLCCSGCNGYKNRFVLPFEIECPRTESQFFDLRDLIFAARVPLIAARLEEERRFYDGKPWEITESGMTKPVGRAMPRPK